MSGAAAGTIFTIGHSTRTLEVLIEMLQAHGVKALADVRLIPQSRRHPHFSAESLGTALPAIGIEYRWFRGLGGRRKPRPDSPHTGWRNESFRGYADYMETPGFLAALDEVMRLAADWPTAMMCAEAEPWRCHRMLIADALVVRGWQVLHIMSRADASPHRLSAFAEVDGLTINYPPVAGPAQSGAGLWSEAADGRD